MVNQFFWWDFLYSRLRPNDQGESWETLSRLLNLPSLHMMPPRFLHLPLLEKAKNHGSPTLGYFRLWFCNSGLNVPLKTGCPVDLRFITQKLQVTSESCRTHKFCKSDRVVLTSPELFTICQQLHLWLGIILESLPFCIVIFQQHSTAVQMIYILIYPGQHLTFGNILINMSSINMGIYIIIELLLTSL